MTRSQFLELARKRTGLRVTRQHIDTAIDTGHIPKPSKKRGGWWVYEESSLPNFIDYIENHSRLGMLQSGAAS